jgi:transcriptional regulator with XRE-family HTH domain
MLHMGMGTSELSPLGEFIEHHVQKRGWSLRTLAMYASLAPSTVSNAVSARHTPSPETLRRIAEVLEVDESHLLRLAGHLEETPFGLNDPAVLAMAYRLEDLLPDERMRTIQALDMMIGATRSSGIPDDAKQARIRELKAAIRAAQQYLKELEENGEDD